MANIDLTELLANLSAADTCHDFKKTITASKFNNSIQIKNAFKEGLYNNKKYDVVAYDEDEIIEKVIQTPSNYRHDTFLNKKNENTVITKNKRQYSVRYCAATNGDDYIDAKTFIDTLNIPNGAAFVVDAAALSINKILQDKSRVSDTFKIYYLLSAEVLNDPAKKTPLGSSALQNSVFIPCEPYNDKNKMYIYSCDDKNGFNNEYPIPDNSFFTRYQFKLSGLKFKDNNSKWYTDLLITYNNQKSDKPFRSEGTYIKSALNNNDDNGDENDKKNSNAINSLLGRISDIFKNLASIFKTNKKKEDTLFELNSKLQQKRSGDWLQVLFCIAARSRKFVHYYDDTKKVENLEHVYLVTHDRIAMSFALLMGVNVIFTHGADSAIYSYKFNDEKNFIKNRKQKVMDLDISEIENKCEDILKKIKEYSGFFNDFLKTVLKKMNPYLTTLKSTDMNDSTKNFLVDNIRGLFANIFSYCHFINEFPNIETEYKGYFEKQTDKWRKLLSSAKQNNYKDDELHKVILNEYAEFIETYNTCNKIRNTYYGEKYIYDISKITRYMETTQHYQLIKKWDIEDIRQTKRKWVIYWKNEPYKTDKNIFLHYMHNLPPEYKMEVKDVMTIMFDKLVAKSNIMITTGWMNVLCAFCLESIHEIEKDDSKLQSLYKKINFGEITNLQENVIIETFQELNESNTILSIVEGDMSASVSEGTVAQASEAGEEGANELMKESRSSRLIIDHDHKKVTYDLLTMDITRYNMIMDTLISNDWDELLKEDGDDSSLYFEKLEKKIINYAMQKGILKENEQFGGRVFFPSGLKKLFSSKTRSKSKTKTRSIPRSSRSKSFSKKIKNKTHKKTPSLNGSQTFRKIHLLRSEFQSVCYHPLIPIYMVLISFNSILSDNIEDSLDYSIFIYYYELLNNMVFHLFALCKKDPVRAYVIGIGLKEWFFRNEIVYNTEDFKSVYGFSPISETHKRIIPNYSLISSLNDQLTYSISGKIPFVSSEKRHSIRLLRSGVFRSFLKEVMHIKYVNSNMNISHLKQISYELNKKVGERIIIDRTKKSK